MNKQNMQQLRNDGQDEAALYIEDLEVKNEKLIGALTDISNMCIGEMAMGYKLEAETIGQLIFETTGMTNTELNAR